jgi:MSHA biogenesis protein MshQ
LNAGNTGTESTFLSSLQAVSSSSGGQKMDVFFTSGTFVAPSGVTNVIVELWAGGGGSSTCSGCNGTAGFYGKSSIAIIPGNSYIVEVGQGGGAGCPYGGCGGRSSFNGIFVDGGRGGSCSTYNPCPIPTSNATFNCTPSNSAPYSCRISPGNIINAAVGGGSASAGGPGLVVVYY